MSVVTFEKPIQHIGLADWHAKQWQNEQTNDARREDAFNLRHESRQLRNETRIRTDWDTFHNNMRLSDRVTELDRWIDVLRSCLRRVDDEIAALKDEKFSTEREIDALGIPLGVVSECISMRDNRLGAELTYDDADNELKRELSVIESVKKNFIDRCLSAWEKINKLNEVRFKLELDINDKTEAREIDQDQLTLNKNCANISHKTDSLRSVKNSIPYETWLEHSKYTKLLADSELTDTYKLRESLFVVRERGRNDMRAQRDTVDFTLRKRIYETQKARNEIQWQQLKMREEMERVQSEIQNLENSIQDKEDAMKLAETRLENRSYRPGFELARDEVENGLKDEVMQVKRTLADILNKLNCAKATYNALEDQQLVIDKDLANKSQSLMTDIRCLDMRIRLRTGEFAGPATDTDRNIVLTRMEKEIPSI